jgi:glycosyltransferase involved in cell wall biosynthesis
MRPTAPTAQVDSQAVSGIGGTGDCTVIVPVYNEAQSVATVVESIVQQLSHESFPHRVLVLNDGSTDWSPELERRLLDAGPVELRSFDCNRGKGAVLNDAFPSLQTEFAVVIDADGEYAAEDIPRILEPLRGGEVDWVMGSRYGLGRGRPRQHLATYVVNRLVNAWFFLLSGVRLHDLLTGVYGFRTELVRQLGLRERRFAYTPELMWKVLRRRRPRLCEVAASYRFRGYAEGKKIRWWETGTILLALLRYRFCDKKGPV